MKNFVVITLMLPAFLQGLWAQSTAAFPTMDAQWNVYLEYSVQEHPTDTVLLRYVLDGDTSINGLEYVRLCLKSSEDESAILTPVGGLREAEKKIYYIGDDFMVYLNPNFDACEPGFLSHNNTIAEHPSKIKLYPNPLAQKLTIENAGGENIRLRLIDRAGRTIVEQALHGATTTLDLTIAPDVFLVQICRDDGTVVLTKKMIKQ